MVTAFLSDAFQSDAFQVESAVVETTGAGAKRRGRITRPTVVTYEGYRGPQGKTYYVSAFITGDRGSMTARATVRGTLVEEDELLLLGVL